MEEPGCRQAHREERPPGGALSHGRGSDGDGSADHATGSRGRRDHGRDHVPRQHHHEGLPEEPQGHRGRLRGRLVPFGRSRGDAARRLHQDQGPRQGHHHLRRREHLVAGGRGRALPAPGGARGRSGRETRPQVGRNAVRFRRAEGRRPSHGKRDHRPLPRESRGLQDAAPRGVRRAAEDVDGKNPEIRAASAREIDLGDRVTEDAMNAPSKTEVETPYVLRGDKDGVATLTLNRGDRMNPLSTAMLFALQAELDRLAKDTAARVVVLAGAGKHFCAGHDLREMRSHPGKAWQKALFEQCSATMLSLVRLPQPVIARVQGVAVAAGCQLVSMCDLAVAADVAQFALPGVKSGIFCTTPGVGVARNLARKHALEMLFTGDLIDAKTALAWGLVNRVAPLAGLDAEVDKLARKIVAHSGAVVSLGKRFFYDQVEKGLADAYSLASEGMACNMMLEDAGEGIDAFIQKRRPDWRGR